VSEQPDQGADALAAVQRGFDLFNAGDLDTLITETFDPEIAYRGDPDISALAGFPTDAEGADAVRAVWEAFFAMFDEVQLTDIELVPEDGETVLGRCHMVAQGGSSGIPIDAPFHFAWVLRDDRWVFMAAKLDRDQVLAALRAWNTGRGSAEGSAYQSSQE
jgi:ketosteroid isomerase-like protein